jgi:hypothetical protein
VSTIYTSTSPTKSRRSLEDQVSEVLRSINADAMLGDYVMRRLETIETLLVRLAREVDRLNAMI